MSRQVLGKHTAPGAPLRASVCVVGGGIAGLLAATRLARDRRRTVIVIESGLESFDASIGDLNRIEDLSGIYGGAVLSRGRGLGGTSSLWSGKLLPLSRPDALARPYVGVTAWPIDMATLDAHTAEIEALMGVDGASYEDDATPLLDPDGLLPRNDPDFVVRWPKRPTNRNHHFAHVLREQIASAPNLHIWLGATLISFDVDASRGRVRGITAGHVDGARMNVEADEFLIAAGTLESTRLLLLADRQAGGLLSQGCDAFGHYFNDHLGVAAATLQPVDHVRVNRMLGDRSTLGAARHLHFELRPEVQVASSVGSAYFDVGVELGEQSALAAARRVLDGLKRLPPAVRGADVAAVVGDIPSLVKTAQWQWLGRRKYWPAHAELTLKIWIEQLPQWSNHIALSSRTDALGVPLIKLEWNKLESDEATLRLAAGKVDRFWKQHLASICGLKWNPEMLEPGATLSSLAYDQAHPAGSTRMGLSAADSVLDPQLKVHRSPNLSIASASAFPSSGSANPTLTVMQLAMHAADAISARLGSSAGR